MATPLGDYFYGASLLPDEDEKQLYPARYARLQDPWGMSLEVVEDASAPAAPCCAKLVLKVLDLEDSVQFYSHALGLQLLRRRSNVNNRPAEASLMARLVSSLLSLLSSRLSRVVAVQGASSETSGVVLELVYDYATEALDLGGAYQHVSLSLPSLSLSLRRP